MSDWCADCQQGQGYHTSTCRELQSLRTRLAELEAAAIRNDERHAEAIGAVRRRAEHAEARVTELEAVVKAAFLSAVTRGDPCPFCLARTDNVWPYCVHFQGVCVLGGVLGEELRESIDEAQNAPDSVSTPRARLDAEGTAKPLTEIAARFPNDGRCIGFAHQVEEYVLRPTKEDHAPVPNAGETVGAPMGGDETSQEVREAPTGDRGTPLGSGALPGDAVPGVSAKPAEAVDPYPSDGPGLGLLESGEHPLVARAMAAGSRLVSRARQIPIPDGETWPEIRDDVDAIADALVELGRRLTLDPRPSDAEIIASLGEGCTCGSPDSGVWDCPVHDEAIAVPAAIAAKRAPRPNEAGPVFPPRMSTENGEDIHHLKCWSEPFYEMRAGRKLFEYRKHDRDFRVGDLLWLEEWDPSAKRKTGDFDRYRVTYLLPGGLFGVPVGYCVMGVEPWAAPRSDYARPKAEGTEPRWTVSAYLMRGDRVLLVHHKRLNMWLPIGGGIEPGERPAEAVLREVREETGFTIDEIDCLGFDEHFTGERIHMNLAHRARVLAKGEPVSDGSWGAWVWHQLGEVPPRGTPENVRACLERLRAETARSEPIVLWASPPDQCESTSPDKKHSCTLIAKHWGVHVATDPVFGNVLEAWLPMPTGSEDRDG